MTGSYSQAGNSGVPTSRPGKGQPDNTSDPYFMLFRNDLADKGFFSSRHRPRS